MKKFILATIIGIYAFAFWYIIGVFYSTAFDISKWSAETRFVISLFGGLTSFICIITSLMWDSIKP
jgi:hypothetical protein